MNIITKRPILSGIILIIIIVITGISIFGGGTTELQTLTIHRTDFVNEISVSGKVVAAQNAELGFDQSGRVSALYAKVGDVVKMGTTIATIENGTIRADIAQKEATLEKERAKLIALQAGTRTEELAVYEQKYIDASSALVIAMRNAYVQTEGAILTKSDTAFTNANTVNPTIVIRTQSDPEKRKIEHERLIINEKLGKWKDALSSLTPSSSSDAIKAVRIIGNDAMSATKIFLDNLASIVGNLATSNSGLTQSSIETYRSNINTAGQLAGTAASTEQEAYGAWTSAFNSLTLQRSGTRSEDVSAQAAQVKSAEADVTSVQAQLRKTLVVAPFDGIVTKIDLKIGEISSPNTSEISLMSAGTFEIESYIPEVNIARVKIQDQANITLDAYGSTVSFAASIISIDPAETLKDGVSTYKTRLRFTENDPRIKSGMTANIRITTERKSNAISVPRSIVTEKDGRHFLQVKAGDVITDVEVTIGDAAGFGQVEILSGLNEGDVVVLPSVTP